MTSDNARASDGGASAVVQSAAATPRGSFKVTATSISVSMGDKSLFAKKGETVELEGAAIQSLLNDGSIEPA